MGSSYGDWPCLCHSRSGGEAPVPWPVDPPRPSKDSIKPQWGKKMSQAEEGSQPRRGALIRPMPRGSVMGCGPRNTSISPAHATALDRLVNLPPYSSASLLRLPPGRPNSCRADCRAMHNDGPRRSGRRRNGSDSPTWPRPQQCRCRRPPPRPVGADRASAPAQGTAG